MADLSIDELVNWVPQRFQQRPVGNTNVSRPAVPAVPSPAVPRENISESSSDESDESGQNSVVGHNESLRADAVDETDNQELIADLQALRVREDGVETLNAGWLEVPGDLMTPMKTCSTSMCMQLIQPGVVVNPIMGSSFNFVGEGEGVPEMLQKVAWAISQINRFSDFNGCIVATRDTRTILGNRKKDPPIIGVQKRFVPSEGKESMCTDYIDGQPRASYIQRGIDNMKGDRSNCGYTTVDKPVAMEWGLIPVEYVDEMGVEQRKIIHVLKVIPMYGFDLMRLIQHKIFGLLNQRCKEQVDVPKVAEFLRNGMACEMTYLEESQEVWEALPDPWSCSDVMIPSNPTNILSPFAVFAKICNIVGKYRPGTLRIDGFPLLDTDERKCRAVDMYNDLEVSYLKGVTWWMKDFRVASSAADPKEVDLVPLLHYNGMRRDRLNCSINMKVEFDMLLEQNHTYETATKLKLPQVVIATALTFFFRVADDHREEAIMAQLTDKLEIATPMNLRNSSSRAGQYGDYPYAAMHSGTRESHDRALRKMFEQGLSLLSRAKSMFNFREMQYIVYENAIRMDLLMSERASQQARILRKMNETGEACQRIADSCDRIAEQQEPTIQVIEQSLLCDEAQTSEYLMAAAMLTFNKHGAYMNALNLSGTRAMLTGDVLLWLGIDNSTWTFFGYTSLFNGGASHMVAPTTDNKGTVTLSTAKANSVGFSNVLVAGYDNLQGMVIFVVSGLSSDDVTYIKVLKYDRSTRSATETANAILFAGNTIIECPSKDMFMRSMIFDEWMRNVDPQAMDALINGIPRDSQPPGVIIKQVPNQNSKSNNGFVMGRLKRLPGIPLMILAIATNQNAPDNNMAEKTKTVGCVINSECPGAHQIQPSDMHTQTGKRKEPFFEYSVMDTCRTSGIPSDHDMCRDICNIMTIVPMMGRHHVAIVNKLGAVRYEICKVHMLCLEWFFQYYQKSFVNIMGSFLQMSYQRICGVQTSRGVANCLMSTVLTHVRRSGVSYKDACVNAVSDMQSSATTVAQVFRIMNEVVRKSVCTNMLMISGIITSTLNTPVLSLDFLCSVIDPARSINVSCDDYRRLREYLESLCQCRRNRDDGDGARNTTELLGSYALVRDLVTSKKYNEWEQLLERYVSVIKGSAKLYMNACNECTQRSIDISKILNVDPDVVSLKNMCARMRVEYDNAWDCPPDTGDRVGRNFLFCMYQREENSAHASVSKAFVNVVMHLFCTALVGRPYVHSDNRDTFSLELMNFMARTNMPASCVPSRVVLFTQFITDGMVKPQVLRLDAWDQPDYFTRSVTDDKPWVYGRFAELDVSYWNYAIEDVMHMGPYLQTLENLQAGKPLDMDTRIEWIPYLSHRAPELVVGRIYPIFFEGADDSGNPVDCTGTICIAPAGLSFVRVCVGDAAFAVPFEHWFRFLQLKQCVVGPLVHRANAVVAIDDRHNVGLLQPIEVVFDDFSAYNNWDVRYQTQKYNDSVLEKRSFVDQNGQYVAWRGDDDLSDETVVVMSPLAVHRSLVPMGTHMFVRIDCLPKALSHRMRHATMHSYIEGWLRCPLPSEKRGDFKKIYVGFRVMLSDHCDQFNSVEVVPVYPRACKLRVTESYTTYILPA